MQPSALDKSFRSAKDARARCRAEMAEPGFSNSAFMDWTLSQLIALEQRFAAGDVEAGQESADLVNEAIGKWKLGRAPRVKFNRLAGRTFDWDSFTADLTAPPLQALALWKSIELMEQRLLTRVRRCRREGCGRWYFGVFDHQMYHSEACRVATISADPKYKERRKLKMRERRKQSRKGRKS
jgi:hypothetical protein